MGVSIVGWAHSPFGKFDSLDIESLIGGVVRDAIVHTGIQGDDVDGTSLGTLNGGFVPDILSSSLPMRVDDSLRWKQAVRVENACALGSAAIYGAIIAIEVGDAKVALVVGAEKMSSVNGNDATRILANCSCGKEKVGFQAGLPECSVR
jgi:acetyl-CoA C-acetyltransferase